MVKLFRNKKLEACVERQRLLLLENRYYRTTLKKIIYGELTEEELIEFFKKHRYIELGREIQEELEKLKK